MPILAQGQAAISAAAVLGPIEGSNAGIELRKVVFTNTSVSARTVTYGVTKAGGTAGADGTLQGKTVPLGAAGTDTAIIDATELAYMHLGPGDSLVVLASAASAVTYTVSGVESTARGVR